MVYVLSSTFLFLRQTSLINYRADKPVLGLRILCKMFTTGGTTSGRELALAFLGPCDLYNSPVLSSHDYVKQRTLNVLSR